MYLNFHLANTMETVLQLARARLLQMIPANAK